MITAVQARRVAVVAGICSAIALVASFVFLAPINDIGDPDTLGRGVAEIAAHPNATVGAACATTFALVTGTVLVWALVGLVPSEGTRLARVGAWLATAGASANCVGVISLMPLARAVELQAISSSAAGRWANTALMLDAAYNLLVGLGLLALGTAQLRGAWPKTLSRLAIAAGVVSLPVSFEWYSNAAGQVQYGSEALILLWQIATVGYFIGSTSRRSATPPRRLSWEADRQHRVSFVRR